MSESKAIQKFFVIDLRSGVISPDPTITTSDVAILQREELAKQLVFTILDPDKALGDPEDYDAQSNPNALHSCHLAYKNINKYNPDEYVEDVLPCFSGTRTYNKGTKCFYSSRTLLQNMTQFPGKLSICLQILDASADGVQRFFRTLPLNLTVLPSHDLTISDFTGEDPDLTNTVQSDFDRLFANVVIGDGRLLDGAVTESKIADLAVSTNKIADDAVTSDKIKEKEVKEKNIADLAVSTSKIADDAVTSDKIDDGEVKENNIADGAVTIDKIADGSITAAKITSSSLFNEPLTYYIRRKEGGTFLGFNAKGQSQQSSENGVITSINDLITQYYKKGLSIKAAIGINDDGSSFFWGDLLWISATKCVFGGQYRSNYYQLEFIERGSNLEVDVFTVIPFASTFTVSCGLNDGVEEPSAGATAIHQHYQNGDHIILISGDSSNPAIYQLSNISQAQATFLHYELSSSAIQIDRVIVSENSYSYDTQQISFSS